MTITLPSARVLGIPELLAHIFSLSTRQANAVHARVCKEWSDAALDVLWRKVTNVAHLMRLLSPLEAEYDEDGDVTWVRPSITTRVERVIDLSVY